MYERDRKFVIPPDGGWGWVVVIAAFAVCAIVDGIAMNAATIYVNFPSFIRAMNAEHAKLPAARCIVVNPAIETGVEPAPCPSFSGSNPIDSPVNPQNGGAPGTEETEPEVTFEPMANFFIGATLISIYMLIGPFSAALINVYGSRRIIIIGSIIAAIGFSLSALLIEHERILLLTHGVAGGIGLGLMNVGAIVSVGLYFNTRRSLAIGLALCGSGAGMTIAPLVIEPILTEHGLYYAYVVLACFSLQGVVAGVLVRPLQPISPDRKLQSRRKDVVDRVLEWSKHVKHIRESDSVNSLNNPEALNRVKNEVLKTRQQRILRLEVESVPPSVIGSRMSMENQQNQLLYNGATATQTEVLHSPAVRVDPLFCQVFGSDLLSPFPRPSSSATPASPEGGVAATPSPPPQMTAVMSTNSALAAAGVNFGELANPSSAAPPVFFLTLPMPTAVISTTQRPVWSSNTNPDELYCFTRPSACVCSVLLDGGMLVASKIISSQSFAKSCPELSQTSQITELRIRRRPVTSSNDKATDTNSISGSSRDVQPLLPRQPELASTPQTTKPGPRRRRQRSSGSRFVPSTGPVFETQEIQENQIMQQPPQQVEGDQPWSSMGVNNEADDQLPEVVISNAVQPRRMIRRRTGAVLDEQQQQRQGSNLNLPLPNGPDEQIGRDSGISNSSSSDTSDKASQKNLVVDDVVVPMLPPVAIPRNSNANNAEEDDDSDDESDGENEQLLDGQGEEQTQSTKSYIERRRQRRQLVRNKMYEENENLAAIEPGETPQRNVFRHLTTVLEAILDISLLKDVRFWIILFGNLLLMVTFLLLPLNADVVKTIRALDSLHAQHQQQQQMQAQMLQLGGSQTVLVSPLLMVFNNQTSTEETISSFDEYTQSTAVDFGLESVNEEPAPLEWTPEEDDFGPNELYEPMPHMYAILLSVCGCTQTIVRAVAGFFADYPRVDATVMVTVAMAVGSVAFFLLGLETILMLGIGVFFALLVVVSACSGVFFALATTVIVDTFGVERLTSCFGMITMIRGLAPYVTIGFMLSVSQLIEAQEPNSGNDLLPFRIACILCAGLVFICSLLHGLLYWLRKRKSPSQQSVVIDENNTNNNASPVPVESLQ